MNDSRKNNLVEFIKEREALSNADVRRAVSLLKKHKLTEHEYLDSIKQ